MKVLSKYFTDRLFIVYVIVFISNFAFTWGSEDDNVSAPLNQQFQINFS